MNSELFKLDEFCIQNKIEYMVTGTMALKLLGFPSSYRPRGIDIKVFHVTPEQRAKFLELQYLSGLTDKCYKDGEGYTIAVGPVKVNIIIDNDSDYEDIFNESVSLRIEDRASIKLRQIHVQKVSEALAAKMKLNREKDKEYMLNAIHLLTKI